MIIKKIKLYLKISKQKLGNQLSMMQNLEDFKKTIIIIPMSYQFFKL